jgi:LytS/YehU family sensor histidine kinase
MRFVVPAVFSLTVYLLGGIYALVIDFYRRERASRAIEHEKTDIKLQFLRNQLNPHFLFNSLNSIYSLVRSKSDDAPEAVITLSELMRYMLYEANDKEVLLEKELNYVQNYISLQRLRIKNSKDVNINIHGDPKALLIHTLILITFIENAFKFGRDFKGQTYIDIKIRIVDHQLHFYVKNAIGIPKETTESSGIGLENIKKQLQYLYENQHSLTINSDKDYYEVDLTLNLNTA